MTSAIKQILVAVKPWESTLPITTSRLAFLARHLKAEVTLVSCIRLSVTESGLVWAESGIASELQNSLPDHTAHESALLEQLAAPLRDAGVSVTTQVRSGSSAMRGISDEVEELRADLLVVGVHKQEASLRLRLADVDWQLIRRCPCPLLLSQGSEDEPYRKILAAIDPLHDHAEPEGLDHAILDIARLIADACGSQLQTVNAFPDPEGFEVVSAIEPSPGIFYGSENIEDAHKEAARALADQFGIATTDVIVNQGKPVAVIGSVLSEQAADLVVLGVTQRGRLEEALLGSTAKEVIKDAGCDSLLVKISHDGST